MRFWFAGPRLFGGLVRPGISFRAPRFGATAPLSGTEAPAGFVYVIRSQGDHRKIGVSGDPQRRLADLQTGSPTPLTIEFCAPVYGASAYSVEGEAHAILDAHRLAGEWFSIPLNLAVAAIYGAAERTGASMQPRAATGAIEPGFTGWWGRRRFLSRIAILTVVGTLVDALAMPPHSPFLFWWIVVGAVIVVFT